MDLVVFIHRTPSFLKQPHHLPPVETIVRHRILGRILRADDIRAVILVRVERPVDNDDPATRSQHPDQGTKHRQRVRDVVQRHAHDRQVEITKVVGGDRRAAAGLHQVTLNGPHFRGLEAQPSGVFVIELNHAGREVDAADFADEGVECLFSIC